LDVASDVAVIVTVPAERPETTPVRLTLATLSFEDVKELNYAYFAQLNEEARRKDHGGIYKYTQVNLAYNSNKMEGNRMSLDDTTTLFETGIVPDGEYRPKDIEEMRGHFVMFNNAMGGFYSPLSEDVIKKYHYDLQCGVFEFIANGYKPGEYKAKVNTVNGVTTSLPQDVKKDIVTLLNSYDSLSEDPLEKLALFHCKYETIHPFQDGNGRTGRMIMFKETFAQNTIPLIIDDKRKMDYRDALKFYQSGGDVKMLKDYLESCQEKFFSVLQEYMYDHSISLDFLEEEGEER